MSRFNRWSIYGMVLLSLSGQEFFGTSVMAGGPGVPKLGNAPPNYVGYAVTNLPTWYRTLPLQVANNTPASNPITNAGAELGRVLFYDARLSHNNGIACASCHVQENGFSDPKQFSEGFEGGLTGRHSMGLSNAKFYAAEAFFWDERAATLEDQVLLPIQDAVEMGSRLDDLIQELQQTEYYPVLFRRAFGDNQVTSERMAESLAQFVRSMVSYNSKFDRARAAGPLNSPGFNAQLTPRERRGHALFVGARCAQCHGTDAHVADTARNNGLNPTNEGDDGAGNGRFKVPSLRNIAVRDGFMHDGRFITLEEVVDFYSDGVQNNPNLDLRLRVNGPNSPPLRGNFTPVEKDALVAFLNTLTDEEFLTSDIFSDPFVPLNGDFNLDGVVDEDDFLVWKRDVGLLQESVSGPLVADGDDNGRVDAADFVVWRNNLGTRWDDDLHVATPVPEPSTMVLITLGLMSVGLGKFCMKKRVSVKGRPPPV